MKGFFLNSTTCYHKAMKQKYKIWFLTIAVGVFSLTTMLFLVDF